MMSRYQVMSDSLIGGYDDKADGRSSEDVLLIAPIGPEGSDTRVRSDQVLKHIVAPAAKECGYETIRAECVKV
jgi:hypothetical protein